jgi:hypothetical protein
MTLRKAQTAISKAQAQTAKARESLVKALILEAGASPRKVKMIEVTGFRSLVRSLISG